MTDDDDDVYVYTEVHKRYFELFALQEQYGGGNHVITTSEHRKLPLNLSTN
jgi:hypothetical protein